MRTYFKNSTVNEIHKCKGKSTTWNTYEIGILPKQVFMTIMFPLKCSLVVVWKVSQKVLKMMAMREI